MSFRSETIQLAKAELTAIAVNLYQTVLLLCVHVFNYHSSILSCHFKIDDSVCVVSASAMTEAPEQKVGVFVAMPERNGSCKKEQ